MELMTVEEIDKAIELINKRYEITLRDRDTGEIIVIKSDKENINVNPTFLTILQIKDAMEGRR